MKKGQISRQITNVGDGFIVDTARIWRISSEGPPPLTFQDNNGKYGFAKTEGEGEGERKKERKRERGRGTGRKREERRDKANFANMKILNEEKVFQRLFKYFKV
ncbi:hypothetical protein LOAG_10680 [Loa loa]|uniref:Uncharacterized protein n=1 Tax=Loa loa TaxID=7209 RepID=A0A1S0TPZ0_LOALO|nr:hypothetical protein LOAG_10680 [Loa loa]EFO17819.1 hypothetical protein LOAG_10680 [Loa loa]